MTDYTQKHIYQIFASIPAGGMQYIIDTPDPLPPGPPLTTAFRHWNLPPQFPRKALINRALVCYESAGYNTLQADLTNPFASVDAEWDIREYFYRSLTSAKFLASRSNMETMMWIDPGGVHYSTANPPGAENSDYSNLQVILHQFDPRPMFNHDTGDMVHPMPLDRDAGDKLALQFNNADALNWAAVMISYLVPLL